MDIVHFSSWQGGDGAIRVRSHRGGAAPGPHPEAGSALSCTDCTVYAVTELNLHQEPSLDAVVLRFIPRGAPVYRRAGAEMNGYAPVTYDSVPGWAIALGLVATPEEVDATVPCTPAAPTAAATSEIRVMLAPLMLRGGPTVDAEPILVMSEGSRVRLTREGAANGYVTVDYDGVPGWAYADLLTEEGEIP